ncbi:MAG: purine-nucleoside phosphorylase [Oscillospiraceae bacterium]|nr:purine-nucleoside phosphorylase [Oscillospiraceae bacterium]MBR3610878.1 purine-nucleoside phosphorylase [Oscillospiraceae bacterium]
MTYEKVKESADFIREKLSEIPKTAIILGSGLGGLVDFMEEKTVIPYKDIPNFPQSSVAGHAGNFVVGKIEGNLIAAMQGRFHFYEGFSARELCYPLYVMKLLGIENLIVTNAAGGVNRDFKPGDLMIIDNYINFIRVNPLIGDNDDRFGPRFPDMSEPYSPVIREKAVNAAEKLGIDYKTGVYALFNGPCYESAAEIRAFAVLGADAVGMSTVPETICANYLGMKVFGVSCITNMATGIATVKHSHEEVVRVANEASEKLCAWMKELLTNI